MNRVAVLIATYNGSQYLLPQIASIHSQISCEVEIFCADDHSSDTTVRILNENSVNVIHFDEKSGSAANNFIRLINSFCTSENSKDFEYIALCDQDDIWLPTKLIEAIRNLAEGYDCYSGSFYSFRSIENKTPNDLKYVNKKFVLNSLSPVFRSPGPGFTYVFKRDALIKICQDENFQKLAPMGTVQVRWHDWAIFAVACKLKLCWYVDQKPFALYRLHVGNDTGRLTIANIVSRLTFLLNGNFLRQVSIAAMLTDNKYILKKLQRLSILDRLYFISHIKDLRTNLIDRLGLLLLFIIPKQSKHRDKDYEK